MIRIKQKSLTILLCITILAIAFPLTSCTKNNGFDKYFKEHSYEDTSKYIKLANYKGLEYDKIENQVSQEDIQDYIDQLLQYSRTTEELKTGTVTADSIVNFDYSGTLNGVEFDGGTAQGAELNIADNNFIDGFAEALIGHSIGENFDINVTFPEEYGNSDLAGQDAVFNITLNHLVVQKTPEYTEDWVKSNTDFKSKKDLEASIKEELLKRAEQNNDSTLRTTLFNILTEESEIIEYPEDAYKRNYDEYVAAYQNYAENNDIDFAEYLSEEMGMTEDEFYVMAENTAKDETKRELVLYAILEAEGISPAGDDFDSFLTEILEEAGYTPESYEEENGISISELAEENNFYLSYIYKLVMDKVIEYGVEVTL